MYGRKLLISKHFYEKFLKNLVREAKPAREKFRGQRARQNGLVHVTWAWTPHSGHTHFAHPPPRVMCTHKTLTKMWPRKHVRTHKFTQIWSSIRTHIWTHVVAHKLRPHVTTRPHDFGHPDILTHSHICPRSPIKFWAPKQRMDSHVSGNLWATTIFVGCQALFWASTKLGANAHSWTSKADNSWASTHNRGSTRVIVGSHAVLWATTRFPERPREVMDAHT